MRLIWYKHGEACRGTETRETIQADLEAKAMTSLFDEIVAKILPLLAFRTHFVLGCTNMKSTLSTFILGYIF